MYVLEGNDPRVLNFDSLCSNWNGAMSFILIVFFSPKAQSAVVYFMYDRVNFKKKTIKIISQICL